MPQAKTEVALQFPECCAAGVALQHWLLCSADVIMTKSCTAASEKPQCNIEEAALQESGAFLPLSCGFQALTFIRKNVVSIKFPPAILGPEMAAPILWAPGIFWFFLLENPHAHKIPPFRGGFWNFLEGGVEVPILFLWAWGFFRV